jgi:uncharacterized MAPEG superfamily protein
MLALLRTSEGDERMTTDLKMLAWVAGLTLLLWIPYVLARLKAYGLIPTLAYRVDKEPLPPWAEGAKRAHHNAIENLAPFAALVLTAQLAGAANSLTATACVVYFWARVAHYLVSLSTIPYLRTLTFAISWAAMVVIFYEIMT